MSFPNINWEQLQKTIHLDEFNLDSVVNKNWILSFSGGADSVMALLVLLQIHKLRPQKNRKLVLYFLDHCDHSSEISEQRKSIIEYYLAHLNNTQPDLIVKREFFSRDMKFLSKKFKKNFEYLSSRLRRKQQEILSRKYPDSMVVTGHNMSDWFETLLLRLNRGTTLSRLFPFLPLESQDSLIFFRPLVFLAQKEIRKICRDSDFPWWDDPTNFNDSNQRSRMRKNDFIINEDGFRKSARNLVREKLMYLEKSEDSLKVLTQNIQEVCPGREYRMRLSHFEILGEKDKNLLLDFILKKINCWPVSGALRRAALDFSLFYKNLSVHTENWNNTIYLVFRKGRNFSIKPGFDSIPHIPKTIAVYGNELTKKHYIPLPYGKKTVKKIFSEYRLSARQRGCCLVYLDSSTPHEVVSIMLSPFGLKDIHSIHFKE